MAEIIHLTEETFDAAIAGDRPVLVDFWAPWCGPCRMVGPVMEELAAQYDGKAIIAKVNVDEQMALAKRFRVMSIPTVFLFKGGKPAGSMNGAHDAAGYAKLIEENL